MRKGQAALRNALILGATIIVLLVVIGYIARGIVG